MNYFDRMIAERIEEIVEQMLREMFEELMILVFDVWVPRVLLDDFPVMYVMHLIDPILEHRNLWKVNLNERRKKKYFQTEINQLTK